MYEAKHSPEHEPELSYIHSNTLFTPDVWLFLHKIIRAQMFKCFSAGLIYERLLLLYSFCITFILNRLNIIKSHFHFFTPCLQKIKWLLYQKRELKKTARHQFKVASFLFFYSTCEILSRWNKSGERVLTANRSLSEQKKKRFFIQHLQLKL